MARLLFVTATPTDIREGSGTAVAIAVLRKALGEAGHEVVLVEPARPGAPTLASRLRFAWNARRAARRVNAEAIVGFDMDGVFLRRSRIPRVAAIKGVIADEARFERGWTRLSLAVQAKLEGLHVGRADAVITTSAYAAGRLEDLYGPLPSPAKIVPEPVELDRWRAVLESAPPQRPPAPTILCVAHLYPRKDVGTLLQAAARMRRPARVRIVGDGPERANLAALIERLGLESRAALLGHVPFAALAAEYRSADIFCLPSRQEGFGIVFVEAMAAGLPVAAARAGAVPEVVAEGETGLLAEPGDADGLARILDRLAGDPALRRRLGDAGRQRAARFDAPRVAGEFLRAAGLSDAPAGAASRATSP
jgi:glycosyltransferase involved in cell wall biosynthesis